MDPVLILFFGGFGAAFLAILAVALYKPLLMVVPASPSAALRDIAYRLRILGHAVDASTSPIKIPVGSVSAVKIHVRPGPRGTEIRYEVDATSFGWTLVILLMITGYLGLVSLIVAVYIHASAAGFARTRLRPMISNPPLGTLPSPGMRSFLIEGLSEAGRLVSEAYDLEREARQNAIGLILVGAVFLWVVMLLGFQSLLGPAVPGSLLLSVLLALVVSAAAGVLGSWVVYVRSRIVIQELQAEKSLYAGALANETFGAPVPQAQQGALELLLRAALRSPRWREIRRRRRLWHDPIIGFTWFILAWGAFITFALATTGFLSLEWRLGLVGFGSICLVLLVWTIFSERREIRERDERERRDWERRRQEIETTFWKMLSG